MHITSQPFFSLISGVSTDAFLQTLMEAFDKRFGDRWEQEKQISQQLRNELEAKVGGRNIAVCFSTVFPVCIWQWRIFATLPFLL